MLKKITASLSTFLEKNRWGYPLLLFLTGLLTYAYALNELGFYWDDWEVVYLTRLASLSDMASYFLITKRPFVWPYALYGWLVGVDPLGWHVISYLLRFGGVLLLYLAWMRLWPSRKFELRWVGLLLMVFPGFLQQSLSVTYSRQFSAFFLFALSLFLNALAVQAPPSRRWFFWVGSFVAAVLQIFTIEYYVGLELIRPIFLWMLSTEQAAWKKLRQAVLGWLPFLLALIAYIWWRLVVLVSLQPPAGKAAPGLLESLTALSSVDVLVALQKNFFDAYRLVFQTWFVNALNPIYFDVTAKITVLALAVAVALATLALLAAAPEELGEDPFVWQAPLLGIVALVGGALPLWSSGRTSVSGSLWADRFAQAPMIGATLLLVALLSVMLRLRWKPIVFALMLAAAIMTQVSVVNKYRLDWFYQQEFFWQMYWRAPALVRDTAIYSAYIPSLSLPEYDASYALSLLYAHEKTGTQIPYWLFTAESINKLKITPDKPTQASFLNIHFAGDSSAGIAVYYQASHGCLRVFDPVYATDPVLANQMYLLPFSNLKRIQPSSPQAPDPAIFGVEPAAGWCTFFEKADLARQLRDWPQVIRLYEQASTLGLSTSSGGEYLPFIEAYARSGQLPMAYDLSVKAASATPDTSLLLCTNWLRIRKTVKMPRAFITQIRSAFACTW